MQSAALNAIRDRTRGTPFEGKLFIVGGAVRDELLGILHTNDYDLVTTLDSQDLVDLLTPVSSIPPVTYARFGTAMLRIEGADIEIVTARRESYNEDSRKPNVEPATLEEDAFRRDFTANTLLEDLHSGERIDPTAMGMADLSSRTLRTPLEPAATFHDDPLRMLRAVRFRWKLDFVPAPGLYEAVRQSRRRLQIVSRERIRDEFVKILLHPSAPDAFNDLMQLGLFEVIAPEFISTVDCEQGKYHHLDVWDHTLLVLRNLGAGDLTASLAALLHDVGKPPTRTIDPQGNTRFFGHEKVGEAMSRQILRNLRFSEREIDRVALLVGNHMRLGSSPVFTPAAARRLLRDLGEETERLLSLVEADVNALKPGVKAMDVDSIRQKLAEVQTHSPRQQLISPLTGQEIMALTNLPPGREVGRLKNLLTEMVLEGTLQPKDKAAAMEFLKAKIPAHGEAGK